MAQFTKEEARSLLERVVAYSDADEFEVNLNGDDSGNIRYARNTVTTSGYQRDLNLVVQSTFGKRSGIVTLNEFDGEMIERAVRRSEELARLAPENPEWVGLVDPQEYLASRTFFDTTASIGPEYRAQAAADGIIPSRENNLVAAGFFQDSAGSAAMMNSTGQFAYNKQTNVTFSATVRTEDGTGSGWVSRDFNDLSKLDTGRASQIAIDKAIASRNPRAIEPGKYTVILEPAAASGLLQYMFFNIDARSADEGRSYLSRPGGGAKLGERIVDERVTIYSDPTHAEVPTATWAGDGQPLRPTMWIEHGVVKNLSYSRYWAREKGVEPVPAPPNVIMDGSDATLEELVEGTRRGILVTRTWYIRMVDPQTLLLTGLTRDGTFLVDRTHQRSSSAPNESAGLHIQ
jgi:predicted Zn-dependent protease